VALYRIKFYADKKGNQPVRAYIKELAAKNDKSSRIRLNKIREYIKILAIHGATMGEPYMKKIGSDIWELRPLSDRILFAAWTGKSFVLLSHFVKKSQKTPPAEIEKAKRLLKDYKERGEDNGERL
jgi:uncharacterized protein HI_0660